jgi:putative tryptophan/tyrosine transport system substrate-binding protein
MISAHLGVDCAARQSPSPALAHKATMNVTNATKALGTLLSIAFLALAVLPEAVAADAPARVVRVGYMTIAPPAEFNTVPIRLIVQELQRLGYSEGKSLVLVNRHANGNPAGLPEAAAELVKLNVDVIVAITNVHGFAALSATRTIPIVVFGAHGAVETGLAASLSRPGGNLTGTESLAPEIDAKRLQLLKQLVPGLAQLAVLYDAGDGSSPVHLKSVQAGGRALGVAISTLEVRRAVDFDPLFAAAAGKPLGGVMTLDSNLTVLNRQRVMDFALANRLPTVCEFRLMVQAGCLISYGTTFNELAERVAAQIDKILKGTPPGELPMEQMTRFELAINLKTAKALGITIPQSMLVRADEIIQ